MRPPPSPPPVLCALLSEMGYVATPPEQPGAHAFPQVRVKAAGERVYNVLLLCTANSARSLMAEAILNREGRGRFRAFSAGSRPAAAPHPLAISLLSSLGYGTDELSSKNWNGFAAADAPPIDFVLTICDTAAGEKCPAFPGHPLQAHWGLPDPAEVEGTLAEQQAAFLATYRHLAARISAFVNLPFSDLDLAGLKDRLAGIGRMAGATDLTLSGLAA